MRESAHPRSRGENRETGRIRVRSLGSSPLTRGKLPPRSARGRRRGLIPAHAGKTCFRRSVWRRGPAHPRSRGENLFSPFSLATRAGSSPLTRGKRPGCARSRMARRLIPAHAGKTRPIFLYRTPMRAHPRSRGENASFCGRRRLSRGSSPLTRGKPCSMCRRASSVGLIPAHAGKTHAKPGYPKTAEAHPRSRGENCTPGTRVPVTQGSSPLTRGKHHDGRPPGLHRRLIPAHAGKTGAHGLRTCDAEAHPRSRGENLHLVGTRLEDGGSSPLTRGKHRPLTASKPMQRLIPAHAGKTDVHVGSGWWHGAHPRSRGENSRSSLTSSPGRGSSPLTRGKPSTPDAPRVRVGLIPAHAGKTPNTRPSTHSTRAHPRSRGENAEYKALDALDEGSSPLTRGKRRQY